MNPPLTDQAFKELHHPYGKHCGIHQNTCLKISVLRSLCEVRRRHKQPPFVRNDALCMSHRPVLSMRQHLIASPAYLERHGTPRSIAELAKHDVLAWTPPGESVAKLVTRSGTRLPLKPTMTSTDIHLLHESAHFGCFEFDEIAV